MNIKLDSYIIGLRRSIEELPKVLKEWNTIDPELCDNYIDQLTWMLNARDKIKSQAIKEKREAEIIKLFIDFDMVLKSNCYELETVMGISKEIISNG